MTDVQAHIDATDEVSLTDRIAEREAELSPAEARVARYIADNPEHVLYQSAQRIAKQARTSDATVVRTARSLGYSGLGDLKQSIGRTVTTKTHPAARLEWRLQAAQQEAERDLLAQVSMDAIERIESTLTSVPADTLDRFVEHLERANCVFTFGTGVSSTVAEYAAKKLSRLGLVTRQIGGMGFDIADDLMQLRRGDCVVIFCPGRLFREIEVILDCAERLEVPVLLVTSGLPPEVRERMAVILDLAASPSGLTGEVLVPLLVMDAVLLGVGAQDRTRATASSRQLNETRRLIDSRVGGLLRYR